MCSHIGTADAYFFLDGKGRIDIVGWIFQLLECLNHDKYRHAVVDRLAVYTVPHLDQFPISGYGIADGNVFVYLFLGHAQVNEKVRSLGKFGFLLGRHHVNGLATHHPDQVFFAMYDHPLSGKRFRIKSTERIES